MLTYIVRRLLISVVVLWGAVTMLFVMVQAMPGNFIDATIGSARVVDPTVRKNLEAKYGLDGSYIDQYRGYIVKTFWHRDLGSSFVTNESIGRMAANAVSVSLRISLLAVFFYNFVGVVSGVLAAARRYGFFDNVTAFFGVAMTAFPPFVSGIFLTYLFGVKTFQWNFPQWAQLPIVWDPSKVRWVGPTFIPTLSSIQYLILPIITLSLVNVGSTARNARTLMIDVLRSDYLRTAKAKGLSRRKILFRHALRNAAIPLVTSVGADFPNTFGFAILTETIFNINGLGSQMALAAGSQDTPAVLGLAVIIVIGIVLVTLLVDLSYPIIDPRVKLQDVGSS
jgi:ABC-type dipeptide/oligopeptide/nickel transport system permease component